MPAVPKLKVSITLSRDLVERVDREVARHPQLSRSAVIERWLRRASRAEQAAALREETVRYYESLSEDERDEDNAIARASSKRAKNVPYG